MLVLGIFYKKENIKKNNFLSLLLIIYFYKKILIFLKINFIYLDEIGCHKRQQETKVARR